MSCNVMTFWSATGTLLAQGTPPPPRGESDFRSHVWLAYALVLVLLGLFTLWTLLKIRRVRTRLDHLQERFEKAQERKNV
jgi:heme exporter protein CcmD